MVLSQFAYPAALGDLFAAVLALAVSIPCSWPKVPRSLRGCCVWVFNVWGTADLIVAIVLATIYDAIASMRRRLRGYRTFVGSPRRHSYALITFVRVRLAQPAPIFGGRKQF